MIQRITKTWFISNNHEGDFEHITLCYSPFKTKEIKVIATVKKDDRMALVASFDQFENNTNGARQIQYLLEFINEHCAIPMTTEIRTKHSVYKFIADTYKIPTPYNEKRDRRGRNTANKVDMNDYLW